MERRDFFKAGLNQVAKTAVEMADEMVSQRASHWIRPPYVLPELEFLLACTRCDACVDACPYNVIFKLPARLGVQLVGTPAMDLLNKGCHLCEDWPCVQACEPMALSFPETGDGEQQALPLLAMVSINKDSCLPYHGPECGACAPACPVPAAMIWNMEKPDIDSEICTGCGLCREACILEPKAINIYSLKEG